MRTIMAVINYRQTPIGIATNTNHIYLCTSFLFLSAGWDRVSSWDFRRGESVYQHWYGADHRTPGVVSG